MKKGVKRIFWPAVSILAVAFLVSKIPWESFSEAIRNVNFYWVAAAIGLQMAAQTLLATRWVYLLRVHGVYISHFQAIKLTFLGLFYNNVMPGAVGGDLLKGWFITHHSPPDKRLEAAVTVFVDRLIGLIGTIMMGAFASLFVGSEVAYRGIQIRWLPWGVFTMMAAGSLIFFSRHLRRGLFISKLLKMLPFAKQLQQIDEAIRIYRRHITTVLWALFLTVLLQGLTIVAVWFITQGLHFETVRLVYCLIIMPIVWLIGSMIPVPGGVGIIEGCITTLFCVVINPEKPGSAVGQAAALALMNRVVILYICSLPGALVPIFGGHLPRARELQEVLEKEDPEAEIAAKNLTVKELDK